MTTQTIFSTPTEVISAANLTGTRKEQVAQKRAILKAWVATTEGCTYLLALMADKLDAIGRPAAVNGVVDSYNEMLMEQAGEGRLVRSKAGNWGRVVGGKAYMLTRTECEQANVAPGKANN